MYLIFQKIKNKGVLLVEYAVMLAFVVAIGGIFLDHTGIADSINKTVLEVNYVLNGGKPVKNRLQEGMISMEWLEENMLTVAGVGNFKWTDDYAAMSADQRALIDSIAKDLGVDPNNITVIKRTGAWRYEGDTTGPRWHTTSLDVYVGGNFTEADMKSWYPMSTYTYGYYGLDGNKYVQEKTQLLYVETYTGQPRNLDNTSGDTFRKDRSIIYGTDPKNISKDDALKM